MTLTLKSDLLIVSRTARLKTSSPAAEMLRGFFLSQIPEFNRKDHREESDPFPRSLFFALCG